MNKPLLVRLDSGNAAAENIGILIESGCYFIIKRNLRREEWLSMAENCCWDALIPRDGKTVYIGSAWKPVTYRTEDGKLHFAATMQLPLHLKCRLTTSTREK